jgi:hypothetical protein
MKTRFILPVAILGTPVALILLPVSFEHAVSVLFTVGLLAFFGRDYVKTIPPVSMPEDEAPAAPAPVHEAPQYFAVPALVPVVSIDPREERLLEA